MVQEYPKERTKGTRNLLIAGAVATGAIIGLAIYGLTRAKTPEPPEEGRANIYGTVYDAFTKQPLAGVMVTIASIVVVTDEQGYYLHKNIMPGQYTIRFDLEGYEWITLDVTISEGNNEVNVELIPLATKAEFHAGVWDSVTQAAVVDALVKIQGPQTLEQRTNQWGDVSFYDIPAGTYSVTITHTNYQPLQDQVVIPPGRTEVEFYVVYQEPPEMSGIDVYWVLVEPPAVVTGQEFMVRAECVNISGAEGDFDIVCLVNGQRFTQTVHIASPGFKEVIFRNLSIATPGEYNVCVGSKCQSFLVSVNPTGQFCSPLTGAGPFGTFEELTKQVISEYRKIEYTGMNPSPCVRLHVYCPICSNTFDLNYCKDAGLLKYFIAPALLSHIKSAHGIQALYCENIPEGGWQRGDIIIYCDRYMGWDPQGATVVLSGPATYTDYWDPSQNFPYQVGYWVLVGTYKLTITPSRGPSLEPIVRTGIEVTAGNRTYIDLRGQPLP